MVRVSHDMKAQPLFACFQQGDAAVGDAEPPEAVQIAAHYPAEDHLDHGVVGEYGHPVSGSSEQV